MTAEPTFTIKRRPGWGQDLIVSGASTLREALAVAIKSGADLRGTNLSGTNLRGADLSGSDLRGSDLSGSDLRGSDLSDSDLSDSDLSGSNLSGSNLRYSNLRDSDLSGSNLSGSNLSGSNLRYSNLSGSNLSGSNLSGATIKSEKVARLFASVQRLNDPYTFHAFELEAGGVKIMAGCRWFTPAEFCANVAAEYPDTPKATETLAILTFIEGRATDLGIAAQPQSGDSE